VPVKLVYQRDEGQITVALGTEWWVTPTDALLHQLRQLATIQLDFH
jgi:DNA polymerase-3 subunit alpha